MSVYEPQRRRLPPDILVALLIALLLHQLILSGLGLFWEVPEKEPPDEHEVMLVESPPPPQPPPSPPVPPQPKVVPQPKKRPPATQRPVPKTADPVQPEPPIEPPVVAQAPPAPEGPTQQELAKIQLKPDWSSFERAFGREADKERKAYREKSMRNRGTSLRLGAFSAKVQKALHTRKGWVQPGNQEPLGNRQKLFRNYLWVVHEKMHVFFADGFLDSLSMFAPDDPINDISLHAVAEFEILAGGQVNEVRVVKSSGNMMFDAAAVDALYRAGPHRPPPKPLLSWNNRLYLRWGFYRNQRKCGVFNAEPYILRAPGAREEPISSDRFTIIDG